MSQTDVLLILDLAGIAVFAISGALTAVEHQLDVFGVFVLAGLTALGGGLLRDTILGATPPKALTDWRYLAVPAVGALLVFFVHPAVSRMARPLLLFDAAGLGLFTAAGTQKALSFGLGALGAIVLGVLTAIGGGMLRDVLVREIPVVLHREVYALAAALGAVVVVLGDAADANRFFIALLAAAVTFTFRVIARLRQWSAPRPLH